jgi:hypothetical protein
MTDPLTMPAGAEIDRLVAERVMGWRLLNRRAMGWGTGPAIYATGSDDNPTLQGFSPSTDIAHAWPVVERMRSHHDAWMVLEHLPCSDGTDEWRYRFTSGPSGLALSAPLAISRAALAACRPGEA